MIKMDIKSLLEFRKLVKSKKPRFLRSSSKIKKRLNSSWRKPKGLQNKMRLRKKGYPTPLSSGYGSPKLAKNVDYKSGLIPVVVSNKKELQSLNTKCQIAVLSSGLGLKKRLELIEFAEKNNIKILQNTEKIKNKFEKLKQKRTESKEKAKKREQAKKEKQSKKDKKQKSEKTEETNHTKKEKSENTSENSTKKEDKKTQADKVNKEILQKRI